MENIQERHKNYVHRLNEFNRAMAERNRKPPREIIAEGVRQSTKITDEKTVNQLTEKAVAGEAYTQNGNYDTFLFGIAESLENIRCETSSQNEYFSWIDDSRRLMERMTDGFVSEEDIKDKENFIKESWQREAELLTCLSLYEKSNNPLAKERHAELLIKLQRLRQIRSALLTGTKDKADKEPRTREEKERTRRIIKAMEDMREADENGDYHNADVQLQLNELGIGHVQDVEFYRGYSFYTRMLEDQRRADLLKKRSREWSMLNSYAGHPDEYLTMLRHQDDTRETIQERIIRLSGRKMPLTRQTDQHKEKYHERAFDVESFLRLKKMREAARQRGE